MYVVPDNPKDRLALNDNRKANRFPVYEENLDMVAKVLGRLIARGEASAEEIEEFNSLSLIVFGYGYNGVSV